MSGFYFNDDDLSKNMFKLKDKEGVNFEEQLLSVKNQGNRLEEKDCHWDEPLDLRHFYNLEQEEYDTQVAEAFNQQLSLEQQFSIH